MLRSIVRITCAFFLIATFISAQQPASAPPPAPGSPADLVQQGQKLSRDGKLDDALALYQQALDKAPNLYEAHLGAGVVLDLQGDYTEAHEQFTKAIAVAPADSNGQAQRAMAVSYAFEGNTFKAAEYETQVFNARLAKHDTVGAAEIGNELARIYLDAGDADNAHKWYKKGYNTATKKTDLTDADRHLWLFRWESAQARIAARRDNADDAKQHMAAAKTALDDAKNPDQMKFYPYLTGYVALYTGDPKIAIEALQQADQHDPMVLALLGQAYEKSAYAPLAKGCYEKVLEINSHNPANAYARPLAKKKLSGGA
jgi:tetratricopeptide (TPR) repeat protein